MLPGDPLITRSEVLPYSMAFILLVMDEGCSFCLAPTACSGGTPVVAYVVQVMVGLFEGIGPWGRIEKFRWFDSAKIFCT